MDESDPRPLNAATPTDAVRLLLADAERVSRELAEMADQMVARAEAERRDAQRLIAALREAAEVLAADESDAAMPVEEAPPPAAAGDGARILARQMLANGADREEVERDLRSSFGIENADAVVASILTSGD
jgi:hypothetical protein